MSNTTDKAKSDLEVLFYKDIDNEHWEKVLAKAVMGNAAPNTVNDDDINGLIESVKQDTWEAIADVEGWRDVKKVSNLYMEALWKQIASKVEDKYYNLSFDYEAYIDNPVLFIRTTDIPIYNETLDTYEYEVVVNDYSDIQRVINASTGYDKLYALLERVKLSVAGENDGKLSPILKEIKHKSVSEVIEANIPPKAQMNDIINKGCLYHTAYPLDVKLAISAALIAKNIADDILESYPPDTATTEVFVKGTVVKAICAYSDGTTLDITNTKDVSEVVSRISKP